MVKLLENTFRAVNIGMVNELALMCDQMGIDVWEVVDAAKTKPFGFMPFYPGPGLGGHCIPVDPFYLSWKAKQFGFDARFIELAGHVNGSMPHHVVTRIQDALNTQRKALNGSTVLVAGITYKATRRSNRTRSSMGRRSWWTRETPRGSGRRTCSGSGRRRRSLRSRNP
jgi:UDP-N-acetyl-D-glucosamine dehydrogenase